MRNVSLIGEEARDRLERDLLARWFPACVSRRGGFRQDFATDWTPCGRGERSVVFQSRMTWLTATVAEAGIDGAYFDYARNGLRLLADRFIDPATGAAAWRFGAHGAPDGPHAHERHAYGQAFAIYGLAAAARALGSSEALDLARRAFAYLEAHHLDPELGGYFEVTDLSGRPVLDQPGTDAIGTPYGWKSQNTHLHLLEAFAELYRVWPDPRLETRLEELIRFFLGPLWASDGWLHIYVERDWTPIPGPVSHGHDVEAAHLILDAARTLNREDGQVRSCAQALVDYALRTGWHDAGGFFYAGTPDGRVTDDTKSWWAQAEGLLGLATVFDLTGDPRYAEALAAQWAWIRDHQIDPIYGGWFEALAPDGSVRPPFVKGREWKAAYHDGRALLFTSRLLRTGVASR